MFKVLMLIVVSMSFVGCGYYASEGSGYTAPPVAAPQGNSASFKGMDTSTQGNWKGAYGADGNSIALGTPSIPSYASLSVASDLLYNWASSTTDARGLSLPSSSSRNATCFYSQSSFSFDIKLTDGKLHQVAFYAVDWDNYTGGRKQTVQVSDGDTNVVLSSNVLSSFQGGVYLVYNMSGHVKVTITNNNSGNAVISGVFFN